MYHNIASGGRYWVSGQGTLWTDWRGRQSYRKYVYDIFGPGVNMAARLEALSQPMKITISESTYHLLKDDFICSDRGEFDVKGFGSSTLYFLERELPQCR